MTLMPSNKKFAVSPLPKRSGNLADAMKDADMFLGLSVGNVVTQDMVKSMAKNPIVFALGQSRT
jgi:malate dehydrogenase (oxaloacetate-decarboxylating)(NADP+)